VPVSLIYFFRFKAKKKIPCFSLSFALNEYERRTLGAPVSLIYFFRFKARKKHFSLIFALRKYERRTLLFDSICHDKINFSRFYIFKVNSGIREGSGFEWKRQKAGWDPLI
jgi:hypothetical protein